MEARRLMAWALAFAVASLGRARYLRVVVPTYWDAEVKPALMGDLPGGAAGPERGHSRKPGNARDHRERRIQLAAGEVGGSPGLGGSPRLFQQRSVKTDRLALRCGSSRVQVEVKQDLMGTGRPARPEEVTLGGCPPAEVDARARVLVFESELHGCGSTLEVRDNALVYAFALVYEPKKADRTPIVRTQGAVVGVECHYLT